MPAESSNTTLLLERFRGGDQDALADLLDQNLDWIRKFVHNRLGRDLRKFGDTGDFVQEAVVNLLRFGPRFVLDSREQFRALMAKTVLNVLRSKHRELFALKRDVQREKTLGSDSMLYLDRPRSTVSRPEQVAEEAEEREWLRLGLMLLDPADHDLLDMHWKGMTDAEIGERLGIQANAARMRRNRVVARLGRTIYDLQQGRVEAALAERLPDSTEE